MEHYEIGDIVTMKKQHPCGSYDWKVCRTGVDFRIDCLGCGRSVLIARPKFLKAVRRVRHAAETEET